MNIFGEQCCTLIKKKPFLASRLTARFAFCDSFCISGLILSSPLLYKQGNSSFICDECYQRPPFPQSLKFS
jgi:hypothetical protein